MTQMEVRPTASISLGEPDQVTARAQRMDSRSSIAAGIAHELKGLNAAVIASIENAAAEPLNTRRAEWLEEAIWAARAADRLIQQLLSLFSGETCR